MFCKSNILSNLKFLSVLVLFLLLNQCSKEEKSAIRSEHCLKMRYQALTGCGSPVCYYDAVMRRNGLVNMKEIDTGFVVNLRYATNENFTGLNMYCCLRRAYLQPPIAKMLQNSLNYLRKLKPGYTLIIFDAARPLQVQQLMWDNLDLPLHEKVKYLSNPKFGSLHNYGAAVDVSVIDHSGKELDMGTQYDHIGNEAHPVMEFEMLKSGMLTSGQLENRQLLRNVMRKGGFWGIQTEWWHFNAMTRDEARQKFQIIQ